MTALMTAEFKADPASDFAEAVFNGLSQQRKVIPARFFYDYLGSQLFEQITVLPEYYPTRTETALLRGHAAEIARLAGTGHTLVEFGAGSAVKTPIIIAACSPSEYVPIDIAGDFLADSVKAISRQFPDLAVRPVAGDFTQPLSLPITGGRRMGFFPGSTIGNFDHGAAVDLLRSFRETLGGKASLVIGLDLRKPPRLLEAAYDDAAGVTAAFNLNLLHRINRELAGTIPLDAFEHRAVWNDGLGRIEMHLVAMRDITFEAAGHSFSLRAGESIHTENSYKYTPAEMRIMARASGWEPLVMWTDPGEMFSLHFWTAMPKDMQP